MRSVSCAWSYSSSGCCARRNDATNAGLAHRNNDLAHKAKILSTRCW
jgi:hypothetical protein